eukprot:NODE_25234_length_594_cov_3.927195.p2 GENE.NODE_25234_length_594_cov_3.927195~~NODE_25234_length_594_cov_3.927195.p2  ORF type:complete len:151 (-),score=28.46 NODE_25234_length_594_cov_3.927195:56-508(-)
MSQTREPPEPSFGFKLGSLLCLCVDDRSVTNSEEYVIVGERFEQMFVKGLENPGGFARIDSGPTNVPGTIDDGQATMSSSGITHDVATSLHVDSILEDSASDNSVEQQANVGDERKPGAMQRLRKRVANLCRCTRRAKKKKKKKKKKTVP